MRSRALRQGQVAARGIARGAFIYNKTGSTGLVDNQKTIGDIVDDEVENEIVDYAAAALLIPTSGFQLLLGEDKRNAEIAGCNCMPLKRQMRAVVARATTPLLAYSGLKLRYALLYHSSTRLNAVHIVGGFARLGQWLRTKVRRYSHASITHIAGPRAPTGCFIGGGNISCHKCKRRFRGR